jgi:UDP:flavonoid glycosyltransferase YjiC (YdhE family)
MAKWMARRNALQGIAQLKFDLKYGFIDAAVQQVKDLTEILRDFPADAILADFCFLGAAWLHEQGGPPWAGFSVPTLQALASENVLVVATIFDRSIDSILPDEIPANARITSFIPHPQLLPHVDVMITNGGFNGVQMALANGVPLIGAGKSEDKPEICARIEWLGAGIDLKTDKPAPEQIRVAVGKVLADRSYKNRAQDMQRTMSEYDVPAIVATLLEQLAIAQQSVSGNQS